MGSSSLGDRMEDIINNYRSQINIQEVKKRFPEMTESETPVWHGGPVLMSMFGKYALSVIVLLVHIIFFWAAKFEDIEVIENLLIFNLDFFVKKKKKLTKYENSITDKSWQFI